jgi:hypothetical protein
MAQSQVFHLLVWGFDALFVHPILQESRETCIRGSTPNVDLGGLEGP